MKTTTHKGDLEIDHVSVTDLKSCEYNPRKWSDVSRKGLTESLDEFGFVQPLVVNAAPKRKGVVIGGNFKLDIAKKKGMATVPVVWVNIPDLEREKELNLRLNKAQGEFDFELLASFDENFLKDVGFSSEELDSIFEADETPEQFDLVKELAKLDIINVEIKKGDVYEWPDGSRLACGDSTVAEDMQALMSNAKADLCLTDPPYRLDYLKGKKKNGKPVEGFGAKRDRKYLETDILPENFTELWMGNVAAAAKDDFHIIVYENWKNLREIWGEMEKHWKVKNMLVWHLPNRTQGFSAKYKFFSKHDIAMVGSSPKARALNMATEAELLQNEYETALYAIQGKPHWEGYKKGKRYQPTDFIEYVASDTKSSGQGVVFGTKPLEILIPYVKVLTKRGDLILEPFGGSGSSGAAAITMKRRCYTMEKVPAYAEIIRRRWSKLLGQKPKKIYERKSA
ncbi:MAG: DNA modification methylase [Patescibacteria group bacterium]|nr:DNA modification methylase [Patescibacteria group bacterium]